MAEREYIQLTPVRQRAGFAVVSASRSSLWLGQDHVLCVETEGYTESYKRFYFRDIQAIMLRKTARMLWLAVLTGLFTAMLGFVVLAADPVEIKVVFGILAGICAIPFLMNFLLGPTCACQIRTAVQTEEVPSLSRVRRARKVIGRLRPLIAEAQGTLAPEAIPQLMQQRATSAQSPTRRFVVDDPNAPPRILS